MNITINGTEEQVEGSPTLAELVAKVGRNPNGKGVAVAVNGEVVPRSQWSEKRVADADRVELLEAVQGG